MVTCEAGSLQRHRVCMCEHACTASLSPPLPQVSLPFLCSITPPSVQRFLECWTPVARSRFLLSVNFLCAPPCWQSDDVFCTSCCLSMHSCLSCIFFGRPWCQAGLPVKTSWVVQNPRHLGWCCGRVTSSSLSPQCYFVLNTIDNPGAFDVKIMKKWNRWIYSIFFLAIWFLANSFWEPSWERQGFSREYLRLSVTSCSLHSR